MTHSLAYTAEPGDLYYPRNLVTLIDSEGEWAVEDLGGGVYRVYAWVYGGSP